MLSSGPCSMYAVMYVCLDGHLSYEYYVLYLVVYYIWLCIHLGILVYYVLVVELHAHVAYIRSYDHA